MDMPKRLDLSLRTSTPWIAAWLFTIGYLHLSFWSGLLALFFWPYDLGVHFGMPHP